jgi:hypothetical protein
MGMKEKVKNQFQTSIMGTKVSGMPNAGIMWFCVKLIH